MKAKITQKNFIEALRIISCFCVIVNHSASWVFLDSTPKNGDWWVSLAWFFASKHAVPIFIMITGYLLLGKIDNWRKSFHRIWRIIETIIICGIVYSVHNGLVSPNVDACSIMRNILTVYINIPSNALWYLYTYLGLLLMLPFLQKMAAMMEKNDYYILFIVSLIFYSIIPMLRHYSNIIGYNEHLYIPLFSSYICMLFLGQYFARYGVKKSKCRFVCAIIVFLAMVAFNTIATYYEYNLNKTDFFFWDNRNFFPILLQSISMFYIGTFYDAPKTEHIVSYIGSCTFGIYLISDITLYHVLPIYSTLCGIMHKFIAVIVIEIAVFIVGCVVTILLKKIPIIRRIL